MLTKCLLLGLEFITLNLLKLCSSCIIVHLFFFFFLEKTKTFLWGKAAPSRFSKDSKRLRNSGREETGVHGAYGTGQGVISEPADFGSRQPVFLSQPCHLQAV